MGFPYPPVGRRRRLLKWSRIVHLVDSTSPLCPRCRRPPRRRLCSVRRYPPQHGFYCLYFQGLELVPYLVARRSRGGAICRLKPRCGCGSEQTSCSLSRSSKQNDRTKPTLAWGFSLEGVAYSLQRPSAPSSSASYRAMEPQQIQTALSPRYGSSASSKA